MNQKISKLEAAGRQLTEAIILVFERRDPVAVHTLVAAAHQVIYDLCKKKGIKNSALKDALHIRPDKKKEWFAKVAEAENFFKHADRDPGNTLEFNPETSKWFIVDALQLLAQLTGDFTPAGRIFLAYFVQLHPDLLEEDAAKALLPQLAQLKIERDDFGFYLDAIRLVREHGSFEAAYEHLKKGGDLPKERR
jgi:hypothetical protein